MKFKFAIVFFLFIFSTKNNHIIAQKTWNGTISTDWNAALNWTPNGVPTSSDSVYLTDDLDIKLSANAVALNITFPLYSKNDINLDLNGYELLIAHDINFGIFSGTPAKSGSIQTITVGSGTLNCRNIIMPETGHKKFQNLISITTGSLICNDIEMASCKDCDDMNTITMTRAGNISVNGSLIGGTENGGNDGTISIGSTGNFNINFSGSTGTQIIPSGTFCNVVISGSGTKKLSGDINIKPWCKLIWSGNSTIDYNGATLSYGANSYLVYEDNSNGYSYSTGNEWPITDGPPKVIVNLTGTSNPKITISADKTIPDTLNIIAGNLAISNKTLTLNGKIMGLGTLSSNGTTSNLTIGGTGDFGTIYMDQTTNGSSNRLNNLTYNRTLGSIFLGDTLQVIGIISANNGVLTTNNKLILAANSPTNYGQMSGLGSGSVSGNVKVQKVLENVNAGWRHFALPVKNTVNNISGVQVRTTANPSNQQSIYFWDASQNNTTGVAKGYIAGTNTDNESKAYAIYNNNANTGVHEISKNISIVGELSQANYTISIPNYIDAQNPNASSSNAKGWNFIPNKFASNIDVSNFIGDTDFKSAYKAVHVWDINANQYIAINSSSLINYNTGSNIATSNNIAPWQGFWVKATASGQTVTIKKAHQTTDMTGVQQFMKSAPDFMRLNVKDDKGFMDQIAVLFANDATENFDGDKDLYKLKSISGEVPTLYIIENTNEQSATALPYITKRTVQLAFESYTNGNTYTFSPDFDNFDFNGEVILEDLKTGTLTDLRTNTYQFTHDNSFVAQRFLLHFNAKENTSSVNTNINQERTYVYGGNEGIMVHYANLANGTDGTVTIFNTLGQQVYTNTVANGQTINFQPSAPMQVYMVTIVTNGKAKTHKLLY